MKMAICQMKVVPGRPDLNADYMIGEIEAAKKRGAEIVVFPELCVPGYLIGDLFENEGFVRDVLYHNERIMTATKGGIAAVFGSLDIDGDKKGEDGRLRLFNAGLAAQDGKWIGRTVKTLQPNYRIFDDDRHFFSSRKMSGETGESLEKLLQPIEIQIGGKAVKVGVILCEDMWHGDYAANPSETLVKNGAEILINLSASPWTWQKNRKRHAVVKELLSECKVPFAYVNNMGMQNNGKNVIVFDGSSTVYNEAGEIVFVFPPHESGTKDFILKSDAQVLETVKIDDAAELYQAVFCGLKEYFETLPPEKRKAVVGLSGGIDSATSAVLLAKVLGPEKVTAINMPSQYNSDQTKNIAATIAKNLGINYETRPVRKIVDAIAEGTDVEPDTLAYENIQARTRMEILAAAAQKIGALYVCNGNKVEFALGYGTMYGDIAGFMAPLGDMVKREVYQLADYMNRVVYGREIIPRECFDIAPTAELKNAQKDPFHYGNLQRRGYHDEMVRAFTEFRRGPEWFLEKYAEGKLEEELKLEEGTLERLFPTNLESRNICFFHPRPMLAAASRPLSRRRAPRWFQKQRFVIQGDTNSFIADLEEKWQMFHRAVFKRVQAPPVLIVTRRAFGFDLRESILPAHFTEKYKQLKENILTCFSQENAVDKKRIAIYGGSFNPPGNHHVEIAKSLAEKFDVVAIIPCGYRADKPSANQLSSIHKKEMSKLAFGDLPKIKMDLFDLENEVYTPNYVLQERYEKLFPVAEIWHVVGGDIVAGGKEGKSQIHTIWQKGKELWKNLNFFILDRPGYEIDPNDLPPHSERMEVKLNGSGTEIRGRLAKGEDISNLVPPAVEEYIQKNKFYI